MFPRPTKFPKPPKSRRDTTHNRLIYKGETNMSTNTLPRRINLFGVRHTRITLTAVAFLLVATAILVSTGSRAANPTSGSINPSVGNSINWVGTATPGGSSPLGEDTCVEGANCDTFRLHVGGSQAAWVGKVLYIRITWMLGANDYDLYVHKCPSMSSTNDDCNSGALVRSSGGGAPLTSEQVGIQPSVSGIDDYTVHVVYFDVAPDQYQATATVLNNPPRPAPPGSGAAAGYVNYPAPNGLGTDAGEPTIGVNWNSEVVGVSDGGTSMFQAGLQTLRVKFANNIAPAPASASWVDVSPPNTSLASLDPILWTDSQTGRTIVSQLTGQDSASALTDNDGVTWVPDQGGGIPSGVDHQAIGGGRWAGDLALIPHPLYANVVYYCSQDLATAFCARSDDGGLTYGPGVPVYFGECGGIHGHPKVSPSDGTVYVPNHTCSSNQGVTVSEDNGITWTVRRVVAGDGNNTAANSFPSDSDPSVEIGAMGTVYFGYKNFDGTAHMAVSRDHGRTWVRDYDVGATFNVVDTAFVAVVAGDDDRAAMAFIGTNGVGGPTSQIWHLYIAHTYDRGASFLTTDATPNDPVQIGTICLAGLGCGSDRNLLDFIDATLDKQGRVLAAYADGCLSGCTNNTSSRSALATIARECSGRGMYATFDSILAVSACGNVGPPPPPPPPATSCDGVNVISDAAGDAENPAPGGLGPTDQADITAVSFSYNATTLTTTMKIANLTQTPSPGTTFTSYYVVWTSSNGTDYATEVDVDGAFISYYWGLWDSSNNQLSTFNAVTGTFTPGANGTITVPVPRNGIGSPTIPVSSASLAAVKNPFAYTVAGEGVLGAGLVFTKFMDRAPNAGFGKWAFVCP
jgi:hypothetical protein